ncbi:hypothetical protein TruAng_000669 [Truncatella angustata]|nr:hypothetical protein TruAng_000669 [Truncatella angustata]
MPGNKESIISSQGPEPQKWPYYKIHDKEAILSDRQGSFKVHTILIDSDEGRAYEKLTTDAERLDYMRKHSVDSWWVVQADTVSFEDNVAGKRYEIKKNSDEYKGLKKLLKKDGSTPDPGTKEWDKMVRTEPSGDYFLDESSPPSIQKSKGTWSLNHAISDGLDFFVLLSSFAGVSGASSQENYTAESGFLGALARYQHSRSHAASGRPLARGEHRIDEGTTIASTTKQANSARSQLILAASIEEAAETIASLLAKRLARSLSIPVKNINTKRPLSTFVVF